MPFALYVGVGNSFSPRAQVNVLGGVDLGGELRLEDNHEKGSEMTNGVFLTHRQLIGVSNLSLAAMRAFFGSPLRRRFNCPSDHPALRNISPPRTAPLSARRTPSIPLHNAAGLAPETTPGRRQMSSRRSPRFIKW